MMRKSLKVALLQETDRGSRDANLDTIEAGLREAAAAGAELVLLQELHNGPYFCQHESVDLFDLAESIPGPSTERIGRLAEALGLVVVASLFERRAAGLYHNTAVVFDRSAAIAGVYRKMHIPDDPAFYEKFYFTPGDLGFEPIDTSVGRLGVLVCWDQWYPEAARLMALAGAELLLYPTAIGWEPNDAQAEKDRQRDAWIIVQRGHAVANGLPLLSCNRTGFEADPSGTGAGIQFWGSSFVAGPQGELLAQAGTGARELLLAEVDLARSEQVRRIWPFLRDRRIDAYADLLRRFRD
ncbi:MULTISPECIES: carbon-nitrogen hydrolase [Rhodanobacter]|uniref:carbon-nitrogen hydrolase n=1 Tax=Rhodanobacter TaxID=75309 RepID=UPI0004260B6F|nr:MULTISPECIES: carbon-nitrogen hydrolase [Rhodanobacter]KZC20421.1 acyltransferase [Rhodanobacter denitrificans]UJJ52634.1 carbon-nitrogen hydrolase [Rhodanobacter denitrificans]UJM95388.1 carbon-nitrogen hydrolase [Rhodanobacter denitrificans]UJM98919.1 carbon-nitrogen hydrolase [Rhodanobacter denitrificans]UJN21666.1 carbon-nitrogen hydrolase [Rhodanobacter denitrificans]